MHATWSFLAFLRNSSLCFTRSTPPTCRKGSTLSTVAMYLGCYGRPTWHRLAQIRCHPHRSGATRAYHCRLPLPRDPHSSGATRASPCHLPAARPAQFRCHPGLPLPPSCRETTRASPCQASPCHLPTARPCMHPSLPCGLSSDAFRSDATDPTTTVSAARMCGGEREQGGLIEAGQDGLIEAGLRLHVGKPVVRI